VILNAPQFVISLLAVLTIPLMQGSGTERSVPKPGIKEVQVSYTSIRPSVTIKIGGTADWVLVTENAVWVASTKPNDIVRIDPATNKILARVRIPVWHSALTACGFRSAGVSPLLFESTPRRTRSAQHFRFHQRVRRAGSRQVRIASGWRQTNMGI
jgi:hypothetical protein